MSRPTVFVDGHVLDGKPQGSSAYIAGLYRALAEIGGVDIRIACHAAESLARWQLDRPGIDWVPMRRHNKYARLAVEMAQLQTRLAPDYSHFQYITPLLKRSRWINTIHDVLFLDLPYYFPWRYRMQNGALFRLSALRSDVVLTVSEYSRDRLHHHFGIPLTRIHVTNNALDGFVDAPAEPIAGLSSGRFLVYVSRFEPRKNQHALVEAFCSAKDAIDEDITLVLVGYPALAYPALDATLAQAGDRVRVLSNLSHAQITWLYRHAAGALYPSHAEGFGMPVIEAVAAGGLSYCANNTALAELAPYVHGNFDSTAPDQIRATILRAVEGRDADQRAAVRDRALARYTWPATAHVFLKALHV